MRVFVKSYGCSSNQADGAILSGCLAQAGYELVSSISETDLVVYNTCAVKDPSESRIIEACKNIPKGKKLVITGCLPLINLDRLNREVKADGVVGPAAGERIVEVVNRVSNGEKIVDFTESSTSKPSLLLPRKEPSSVVSVIPISYGCLGSCTYCCVVFSRGRLRSYSIEEIVQRIKQDVSNGFREFWLTSQDTACFGRDQGTNLPELLNSICEIKGRFIVRVGMMTPNQAIDIVKELVEPFHNKKILKFAHLPVQSGDDRILRRMHRGYTTSDFKNVVQEFRRASPRLTLATDIICGFPGEDKEALESTLLLLKQLKPDIVNVSKFYARPKTRAAEMQDHFVSLSEIKRRSSTVALLAKRIAYEKNKQWVGWQGDMLVDEDGKVSGHCVGHNFAYKPVAVRGASHLLGDTLTVKVTRAFPTYLQGEIVGQVIYANNSYFALEDGPVERRRLYRSRKNNTLFFKNQRSRD